MKGFLRGLAMVGALAVAAVPAGCQRETGGEPLHLTGKIFVFNYRLAYATYMITLNRTEPLPEGATITAEFENPAGGEPLVLQRKLFAAQEKVVLESPDVRCVKKARPYRVSITVEGPDGARLQALQTTVVSDLDQNVLPAHALVVGPAYDKNPEMFKDGKAPEHFETAKCPT